MTIRSNLKLVEATSFEVREGALWGDDGHSSHSLHGLMSIPEATSPELASFFINEYSKKGDVILDPFCGSGSVGFEANLRGRLCFLSDSNPLALRIAKAKLDPADITEVTLKLQLCNVRRPINIAAFSQTFKPFYDVDTFRELVNLKLFLKGSEDPVSRFVEILAADLLHGHTAGYFSVYSSPVASLNPTEQEALNIRRGQTPDYRSVIPRILRKAAMVLRDGVSSQMRDLRRRNKIALSDARNLSAVGTSSVDLSIFTPPLISQINSLDRRWLANWFLGFPTDSVESASSTITSVDDWAEFMNGVLLEVARVSRNGARAVINLREVPMGRETVKLDVVLKDDVKTHLFKYWDVEGLFVNVSKDVKIRHKERDPSREQRSSRVLVLRRR